jgi:putative zinc finger/helix-turn-helix YgiT family protein
MPIRCINCAKADLQGKQIQLSGSVKGKEYTVEMLGLECPSCGYKTIDNRGMTEFGRLLADKYRSENGLLTSTQIRSRRNALHMSQQEFADYLKVGVASVKRWELGKIQDPRSNALIIEKTEPGILNIAEISFCLSSESTVPGWTDAILAQSGTSTNIVVLAEDSITNYVGSRETAHQTGYCIINSQGPLQVKRLIKHQLGTVSAYQADLFLRGHHA